MKNYKKSMRKLCKKKNGKLFKTHKYVRTTRNLTLLAASCSYEAYERLVPYSSR